MNNNPRVHAFKRAQKEKLYLREVSHLLLTVAQEQPILRSLMLTRVQLSPDKGILTIFFYDSEGETHFNEALEYLKLYRPSMRKALANTVKGRYVPELRYAFDDTHEKRERFEALMQKVAESDK